MEMVSSAVLVLADHVERESFARVFQHALGLLGLLQDVGDLRERVETLVEMRAPAAG
jgi:hypothetical protein